MFPIIDFEEDVHFHKRKILAAVCNGELSVAEAQEQLEQLHLAHIAFQAVAEPLFSVIAGKNLGNKIPCGKLKLVKKDN